jgi:hypothetical protein
MPDESNTAQARAFLAELYQQVAVVSQRIEVAERRCHHLAEIDDLLPFPGGRRCVESVPQDARTGDSAWWNQALVH